MTYKHILLPTDGSKLSERAAQAGVELARAVGARVTGLFVAPAPTPLVYDGLVPTAYMTPEEHAALIERGAARYLGAIEKAAKAVGVAYEGVTVTSEYPADAIVEAATKRHCDLICMASHGRKGMAAVLLGSETAKVLAHSPVPVLVHRTGQRAAHEKSAG
jgi:nucleotide-binding universal stress UspA family protein